MVCSLFLQACDSRPVSEACEEDAAALVYDLRDYSSSSAALHVDLVREHGVPHMLLPAHARLQVRDTRYSHCFHILAFAVLCFAFLRPRDLLKLLPIVLTHSS